MSSFKYPARPYVVNWTAWGSFAAALMPMAQVSPPVRLFAFVALFFGGLFFLYALKYYLSMALILLANGNGNGNGNGHSNGNGLFNGNGNGHGLRSLPKNGEHKDKLPHKPFISVHLPLYNEASVVDRLLQSCTNLNYDNYEVVVADDSSDETIAILDQRWAAHPRVKISRRHDRSGFKGGALEKALEVTDPRAEFIAVFDADFIPPPDILQQFLAYFYGVNGNGNGNDEEEPEHPQLVDDRLAVVQGYQWHILNASENWITRGIRTEFSGSYVIERSSQELLGAMKMISGSVFMIRADVLRQHGWGTSITEDWELTLRLYLSGYKVLYTPFIQAPSECVATFKQLARQRMRWAEGHTFNVKQYFFKILSSPNLDPAEKLEFIYYAPYYLQSVFFIIGTACWLLSEVVFRYRLPMLPATIGWALVFTNALSLALMNLTGLFMERGVRRNWSGLLSFILLTYLLVPYQAYAALKGLLEPHEGGWHRTQKTGIITDVVDKLGLGKRMKRLLPKQRKPNKKRRGGVDLGRRLGGLPVSEITRRVPEPVRRKLMDLSPGMRIASGLAAVFLLLGMSVAVISDAQFAPNLAAAAIFVPIFTSLATERRKMATRVISVILSVLLALTLLAIQVAPVVAAPDAFYFHNNAVADGLDMDFAQGSGAASVLFDTPGQSAHWYTAQNYPAGGDDASLSAGSYTLNLYFGSLPGAGQSVDLTVSVYHTRPDGSAPQLITSTITTIDSSTPNPLPLDLGLGSAQTFSQADPQRLRVTVTVDGIGLGGSFGLSFDSAGSPTNLETPNLTVFDPALLLALVAVFIPIVTALLTQRRELAHRVISLALAIIIALALLSTQVQVVTAAPDAFYLHQTGLNDGEQMNTTTGSAGSTLSFDTISQTARWYTELIYPVGGDDSVLDAGSYTFNMYFSQLPGAGWWDTDYLYRQPIAIDSGSAAVGAGYSVSLNFDHDALVTAGKSDAFGDDLRVAQFDGSNWVELNRVVDPYSNWGWTDTQIWFELQDPIPANSTDNSYYIYYGNASAGSPPADPALVFSLADDFTDGALSPDLAVSTAGSGTVVESLVFQEAVLDVPADTDAAMVVAESALPFNREFSVRHRTKLESADFDSTLLGIVEDGFEPAVTDSATETARQRIMVVHDASTEEVYVYYVDASDIRWYWDGVQWDTTLAGYDLWTVDEYHSIELYSDGTDWWIQLGDQWGFSLTVTDPVAWADMQDTGDDFWFYWGEPYDDQFVAFQSSSWIDIRDFVDPEPSSTVGSEQTPGSADITVSVHQTDPDGSNPQPVVSQSLTIDSTSANPLAIDLGSAAQLNFSSSNPQRLRVQVTVDDMTTGGDFVLAYDSGIDPSRLETPSLTVLDVALVLTLAAIFIPIVTALATERRRMAERLISVIISILIALAILAGQVAPVTAAPDSFYFHDSGTGSTPAWYDTNWAYRKLITIDSGQVSVDQSDFVVLVSLASDSELAAKAQDAPTAGYDILFTDSTGTIKLSHQIESFNDSTGELAAWVELTSLTSATDSQIFMYYGNPSAGNQQDPAGTWSNGYESVYHLHDDFADSTTNHADASNNGSADISTGIVGDAQSFDGSSDYIDTNFSSNYGSSQDFTWSGWFRVDGLNATDDILGIEDRGGGDNSEIRFSVRDDQPPSGEADSIDIYIRPDGQSGTSDTATAANADDGNWHYAVVMRGGGNYRVYYDGGQVGSGGVGTAAITSPVTLLIGAQWQTDSSGQRNFFEGDLDEVRTATTARSTSWLQTEYNNISSPGTFFKPIGSEEQSPPSPAGKFMDASSGTGAATLTFDTTGQNGYWYSDLAYPTGLNDATIASGDYTLNMYFNQLPSASAWWDANYQYRQQITVTNDDSVQLAANTIASFSANTAQLITNSKLRSDGNDWRVVYWNGSSWNEISQLVEGGWNSTSTETWFRLQAAIDPAASDGDYYLYYGYSGETTNPSTFTTSEQQLESYLTGDGQSNEAIDWDSTEWGAAQGVQFSSGSSGYWQITHFDFYQNQSDITASGNEVAGFVFDSVDSLEGDQIANGKSDPVATDTFSNFSFNDLAWSSTQPRVKAGTQYYLAILPTSPASRNAAQEWFRWDYDDSGATYRSGCSECKAYGVAQSGTWGFYWVNDGADRVFHVYGREAANADLSTVLGSQATDGVKIQVTVSHSSVDGSGATTIVQSSTIAITSATANPLALSVGSGAQQTFTASDPQLLRAQVEVLDDNGGSFTLAYDSSSDPTNLETPVVTVPDLSLPFAIVAALIPIITMIMTARRRRRMATRVISIVLSLLVVLSLLSHDVISALAAPDAFYLHDTDTGTGPAWYDSDWGYRRKLTVDNTQVSGSSNFQYFPVLVSISHATLADTGNGGNVVQSDGGDILFTDANGTKLDHEIESYDNLNGVLVAWVEVPALSYNTDTDLYIYYGNSIDGSNQWNISGTWDEGGADNFLEVLHLDEPSGNYTGSTSNGYVGTPTGSLAQGSAGQIDGAVEFQGPSTSTVISLADMDFGANDPFTLSAWFYVDTATTWAGIVTKSRDADTDWIGLWVNGTQYLFGWDWQGAPSKGGNLDGSTISTGTWYYGVATFDGTDRRLYLNDQLDAGPSSGYYDGITSVDSRIGNDGTGGTANSFDGFIDEVRFASAVRSLDWIKTEFNNQSDPSSFFDPLGPQETLSVSPSGKYMDTLLGSGSAALTFDTGGQSAYWYSDISYPTGQGDASIAAGDYTLNMYFSALPDDTGWWDSSYDYRQPLTVNAATDAVPADYSIGLTFNHAALVSAGKSMASGDDIRILYWNGLSFQELDRMLEPGSSWNSTTTTVWFKTQAGISASGSDSDYALYYGNSTAGSPPENPANVFYFYDGFESDNFNAWDSTPTGTAGDSIVTSTTQAYSGSYSARAESDTTYPAQAMVLKNIADEPALHATVHYYLESGFSTADDETVIQFAETKGGWQNQLAGTIDSDFSLYMWNAIAGEAYGFGASAPYITTGTWHTLEMAAVISDTAGEARLWLDGTLDGPGEGSGIDLGTDTIDIFAAGIYWATPGDEVNVLYIDDVQLRLWVPNEPSPSLASEQTVPSVDITVSVYHTGTDGSGAQEIITSTSTRITSATSDPYTLDVGTGTQQTFTQADPQLLRVLITVDSVNSGGDFMLAYDSATDHSSLDTPSLVVPDFTLVFVLLAATFPLLTFVLTEQRRRRTAARMLSVAIAVVSALSVASRDVILAVAAPDSFYLHSTGTGSGVTFEEVQSGGNGMDLIHPDGDLAATNWTDAGSNSVYFDEIDETTDDGDTTYAQTSAASGGAGDDLEVTLADFADPGTSDYHVVAYRWRNAGNSTGDASLTFDVELVQGTTVIASRSYSAATFASTTSYEEDTITLTPSEADSITDYNDLRIRFNVTSKDPGSSGSRILRVTWAAFEYNWPESVSTSANLTAEPNQLYLAAISTKNGPPVVQSVTGLGLNWSFVDRQCGGRDQTMVEVWSAIGAPTGDSVVTANFEVADHNAVISVSRYSGVDPLDPIGDLSSANSNGVDGACSGGSDASSGSVDITTTAANSYAYGAFALRSRDLTPASGYQLRDQAQFGLGGEIAGVGTQDKLVASASTVAVDGSFSTNLDWAVIGVEIKARVESPGGELMNANVGSSAATLTFDTPSQDAYWYSELSYPTGADDATIAAGSYTLNMNLSSLPGAGLQTQVETFAALSGTGNQTISTTGFQPKAVLFWITDRTSTGSGADAFYGRGWTDGTNQAAAATAWQDGSDNTWGSMVTDRAIRLIDETGSVLADAGIVSLNSDGFTINWTTAGGSRLVTYLALGGAALTNVEVGSMAIDGSNTTESVSGMGFQPEGILFFGARDTNFDFGDTQEGQAFGVAASPTSRHSSGNRERNNGVGSSGYRDNEVMAPADDLTTPEAEWDIQSFDSGGFTLARDFGVDEGVVLSYMALDGISIAEGILTQPTSTGSQSVSSLSFEPSVVLFDGGDKASASAYESEPEQVFGAATGSNSAAIWIGRNGTAADTDLSTFAAIRSLTAGTPSQNAQALLTSMNSNGFTLNWTNVDSTQRQVGWVALGPADASVDITVSVHHTTADGSNAQLITEASTTIDAGTSTTLALDLGSGSQQTFTAAAPQLLRVQVHVDQINGGGSFVLDYDSVADPSNLETPSLVVPDPSLAFVALAVFFPMLTFVMTGRRRRKMAARVMSVVISVTLVLGILGQDVITAVAAPDVFYLHDTSLGGGTVTYVDTQTSAETTSTSYSLPTIAGGTDQLYLIAVAIYRDSGSSATVSSISGTSLSWSLQVAQCSARINNPRIEVWQAFGSPSSFSATVNISGGTVRRSSAAVSSYSGADPTTPTEGAAGSNYDPANGCSGPYSSGDDTDTTSLSLSSSQANSVLYVATQPRTRSITTPDPDYAERVFVSNSSSGDGANLYVHDRTLASAGTDSADHTLSGTADWDMAGLVINPASGVSPAGKTFDMLVGSAGSTLTFDTGGQNAYWYSDISYPTGAGDSTLAAGSYNLNMYFNSLPGGSAWWDTSYLYRQQVTVTAGSSNAPSGYSVKVQFDHQDLVNNSKSLSSGDDIRVVYWDGGSWIELDRLLDDQSTWNSTTTEIWFQTQAAISATASDTDYYIYYGNSSPGTPPTDWTNVFLFYDDFNDGSLDTGRWICDNVCTESGGTLTLDPLTTLRATATYAIGTDTIWEGRVQLSGDGTEQYYDIWGASNTAGWNDDEIDFWTDSNASWRENGNGGVKTTTIYSEVTPTSFHLYSIARVSSTSIRFFIDGSELTPAHTTDIPNANLRVYVSNDTSYTSAYDFARVRQYVSSEPSATPGAESGQPSVTITATLYHTATDGSDPQLIASSSSTVIDANTANPLALSLGSGSQQTFTAADPRLLRVHITVDSVSAGGSFDLAYDSGADPTNLDTPSLVVPDISLIFTMLAVLIPLLTATLTMKRRTAVRLATVLSSVIVAVGLLASQVAPVTAAPDVFYLHDTGAGTANWYDPDWAYRMPITIDSAQVSGSTDLDYFPVLIDSTVALWADTGNGGHVEQADGGDILFTSANGITKLDHEIESYDNTTGALIAWVEVPTLGATADTTIYIYYGNNAGGLAEWNVSGTWDEGGSQNFRGVWHLNEASGSAVDSTSYGTSGSVSGTVARQASGTVGYGYDYGNNGQVDAGDPGDGHLDFGTNSFTVSMWLNIDQSTGNYQLPLSKGGYQTSSPGYSFETNTSGDTLQFEIADGSNYEISPTSGVSNDIWYYVVGVVDKTNDRLRLYVDGSQIGIGTDISSAGSVSNSDPLTFAFATYDLNGLLDEVRVANSARSPNWIATEFNNQDDPGSFYSVSGEQSPGISPAGKVMNITQGTGASTLTFDTAGQDAYWYSELSYPTGADDGTIAAGSYTANLYFNSLPGGASSVQIDNVSYDTGNTTSLTIPHTTSGANRLMLVGVSYVNYYAPPNLVSSISYNTDPLTFLGAVNNTQSGGDDAWIEIWYRVGPDTGNHDVVVDFDSDNPDGTMVGVMTFTGVDQSIPLGTFAGDEQDGNSASVTVPSAANDLVFATFACEACGGVSFDSPASDQFVQNLGTDYGAGGTQPGASPNVTVTASMSSPDHWAIGGVAIKPAASGSVDITVYAQHTATDGSGATTITSTSTTIDSGTSSPLALDLGSASQLTFTSGSPRLLRMWVEVTGVSGGGSFSLAYDSVADPSSLDTPVVTVPEYGAAFVVLIPLVPYLMAAIWRRRRLAGSIASMMVGAILAISILAGQVVPTAAAPDVFYLHTDATSGLTPAGEYMDYLEGTGGGLDTGSGIDGSVTLSGSANLNTDIIGSSRSGAADGIATAVTANPTGSSISVASSTGFATGDEILLINLQGASGDVADAGNYEFLAVSAVPDGTTINVNSTIANSYDGTTFANQSVVVQRVPQWSTVTINSGGTLTADAWDGTSGGIIVFRATGTVTLNGTGKIDASGLGYRGGAGGTNDGGANGESYDGQNGKGGADNTRGTLGGGSGETYPTQDNTTGTRGGGGGGGQTGSIGEGGAGGAGGGYGGGGGGGGGGSDTANYISGAGGAGGTTGDSAGGGGHGENSGTSGDGGAAGSPGNDGGVSVAVGGGLAGSGATTGQGGHSEDSNDSPGGGGGGGGTYGIADLSQIFFGSGGGGGGDSGAVTGAGETGGDGGGTIFIIADTVDNNATIQLQGADGITATDGDGASGGGAGGSLLIQANSVDNTGGTMTAAGGAGGAKDSNDDAGGGGGGGVGRIRIEADTIIGSTTPAASTTGTPGGGTPTKTFNATGNSYWYHDVAWPTGNDDAIIAAGDYTFNMYFDSLPSAASFPSVAATNTSTTTSAATSHTVNLPSGIQSGELLISLITVYNDSGSTPIDVTWPGGWTEFFEQDATSSTLHLVTSGAYRQATGSEGSSITVTTNVGGYAGHNSYRITGAADPAVQPPEVSTTPYIDDPGTTIDPPSLSPTGGANNYLWLAVAGWRRSGRTLVGSPTNYTNTLDANSGGGAPGVHLVSARRQLNAASEDPGLFTVSANSERKIGATIAVHPAGGLVDITVRVQHTKTDGTDPQLIASASTTIDSATSNPLAFDLGNDPVGQTFTSADPRVLRLTVEVTGVSGGGSFTLAYDGPCASSACSSLDTPVVTVPEFGLAFAAVAALIPAAMGGLWNRRRIAIRARKAHLPRPGAARRPTARRTRQAHLPPAWSTTDPGLEARKR